MATVTAAKLALLATPTIDEQIRGLRIHTLDVLAPAMRNAVVMLKQDCATLWVTLPNAVTVSLAVEVFETARGDALQKLYYQKGASKAKTARKSWHFYGVAIDVIHPTYQWFTGPAAIAVWPTLALRNAAARAWFGAVATAAKARGLKWGGDWTTFKDLPHLYWGKCGPTPIQAPAIYDAAGGGLAGLYDVWAAIGAL